MYLGRFQLLVILSDNNIGSLSSLQQNILEQRHIIIIILPCEVISRSHLPYNNDIVIYIYIYIYIFQYLYQTA